MENKLKELYYDVPTPDLRADILSEIHGAKPKRARPRLRAVSVIAAMAVLLCVAVGAAAVGGVKLLPGVTVYFRDAMGNLVRPNGYHLEQGADAALSETALTNIAPYICSPRDNLYFETDSRAEMERVLDMPLHIPTAAEELEGAGLKYVLHAFGENGEARSISVSLYGDSVECSFRVDLRVNPYSLIAGSKAQMEEYALPDGTPVTLAVFRATSDNEPYLTAFYTIDGALYHLSLDGGSKKELLEEAKAILDTVK